MTTTVSTLTALRARVLAGSVADRELDSAIARALKQPHHEFTSSLDALAELQRIVLPGWRKRMEPTSAETEYAYILWPEKQGLSAVQGVHANEYRAWLGAILSALIAEAEAKETS